MKDKDDNDGKSFRSVIEKEGVNMDTEEGEGER